MKQSNVITANKDHTVESYRFKVLSVFGDAKQDIKQDVDDDEIQVAQPLKIQEEPEEKQQAQNTAKSTAEPSFIEELLKRTEELSDNIVKLQMKIESQESEFKDRLEHEVAQVKEAALKEGEELAKAKFDESLKEIQSKFANSIQKIEEAQNHLKEFFAKSEQELPNTAIQIAKEVIIKEISDNSAKIAYEISKNLIKELQNSSDIEIKVNPEDFDYLKEKFDGKVKLTPDDAISKGGAVVLSKDGNIDGNLLTRFEKIQKILKE